MNLQIETFVVGPLPNNLYLLRDDAAKKFVVVDPSIHSDAALERARTLIQSGWTLDAIWNTHGHFDHIYDNFRWKHEFKTPLWMHRDDEFWIERLRETALWMNLPTPETVTPDDWLHAGQSLQVGAHSCRVLHTPGHSPGSVSFYFAEDEICISGDVIFPNSCGRTDLPGASAQVLRESLKTLCKLPPATQLLPGHFEATSVAQEVQTNPFCHNFDKS